MGGHANCFGIDDYVFAALTLYSANNNDSTHASFANFPQYFRDFFSTCIKFSPVFPSFWKFSDLLGPIWMHLDTSGCIWMHPDAYRSVRTCSTKIDVFLIVYDVFSRLC